MFLELRERVETPAAGTARQPEGDEDQPAAAR